MAYIVVKTINGRQYRYQQRSYREGGRVRTETVYLGPVGGRARREGVLRRIGKFVEANRTRRHGVPDEETMLRQYNEQVERDRQAHERALTELHAQYGLKVSSDWTPPAEPSAEETPSEKGALDASTPTPASA